MGERAERLSRRRVLVDGAVMAGGVAGLGLSLEAEVGAALQELPADHPQAVVSAHELATEAGIGILEGGGTAADAAVAVAAVLSVVEPWFSSVLGGGTWGLHYDAISQQVTSLDGVGPVGRNVDVDDYERRADQPGIHQAIVPGAWDGWMVWLDRYGVLELPQVLQPAISIARSGYPASPTMVEWLQRLEARVLGHEPAARIYAPGGTMLETGDTVYQTDMAATLEAIGAAYDQSRGAGRGAAIQAARDYVYRGPVAEAIVAFSDDANGYLTLDDFASFEAEIVEPIAIDYTDEIRVVQNPPNSQGITMLLALNILKGIDFSGLNIDDPWVVHAQVEAIKLAFADRYSYIGDPTRVDVPIAELLSNDYAALQRERIDPEQAMEWPIEGGLGKSGLSHTSTFHVVDRWGNVAGVTTSLGAQFLVVGDTGVHINERMQFLSLEPGNPNQMTPGYKVRHTSSPYMVLRNGRIHVSGGNTGVDTQPQAQAQQFVSMFDFGLSPQRAVDRPRFVSTAFPDTRYPYAVNNELQVEDGFPDDLIASLEQRGHTVVKGAGIVGAAAILMVENGEVSLGVESRSATASGRVVQISGGVAGLSYS